MAGPGEGARLRELLAAAEPDPRAVEQAAAAAFGQLKRTDMRSGIANMIRRLAQLAASGDQPIDPAGWRILAASARLLDRPGLSPGDVRALDERLRAAGLDVDLRPAAPGRTSESGTGRGSSPRTSE
jgi:hypothetical protein